jgi:hypothetical protein
MLLHILASYENLQFLIHKLLKETEYLIDYCRVSYVVLQNYVYVSLFEMRANFAN